MDLSPRKDINADGERLGAAAGPSPAAAPASEIDRAQFVQIRDFLGADVRDRILDIALRREADFAASSVVTDDADYRRSRVLFDLGECRALFEPALRAVLPWIYRRLGFANVGDATLEMQLTAHNDGDFYKVHNDNGSSDTASRGISYVYYFSSEPKRFSGGALRLFDSRVENGYWVAADSFHVVEPYNDSIVLFLSRLLHEVMPIRCPSGGFADSRFSINGWIRDIGVA